MDYVFLKENLFWVKKQKYVQSGLLGVIAGLGPQKRSPDGVGAVSSWLVESTSSCSCLIVSPPSLSFSQQISPHIRFAAGARSGYTSSNSENHSTMKQHAVLSASEMDQWETTTQQLDSSSVSPASLDPAHDSHALPRQRFDAEVKDPVVARKVQKADREKLRRDKQNEHFLELGNTIDPDRPKNDKATILTDTIQLLKDLVNEVNRLKTEHASLSEESRELSQEKNELRDEKASLKSDVDNLNRQYQQRMRSMYPWTAMESPVVVAPSYSYPVPVSVAPAPIPMHPSLQPFHFFGNQNYGAIPNPCSNFIPYPNRNNPQNDHVMPKASTSHVPNKHDHKTKTNDSIDVATELELKTPGSAAHSEMSLIKCKGKQSQKKEKNVLDRHSSSSRFEDSSSNSVGHLPEASNTGSSGN